MGQARALRHLHIDGLEIGGDISAAVCGTGWGRGRGSMAGGGGGSDGAGLDACGGGGCGGRGWGWLPGRLMVGAGCEVGPKSGLTATGLAGLGASVGEDATWPLPGRELGLGDEAGAGSGTGVPLAGRDPGFELGFKGEVPSTCKAGWEEEGRLVLAAGSLLAGREALGDAGPAAAAAAAAAAGVALAGLDGGLEPGSDGARDPD